MSIGIRRSTHPCSSPAKGNDAPATVHCAIGRPTVDINHTRPYNVENADDGHGYGRICFIEHGLVGGGLSHMHVLGRKKDWVRTATGYVYSCSSSRFVAARLWCGCEITRNGFRFRARL